MAGMSAGRAVTLVELLVTLGFVVLLGSMALTGLVEVSAEQAKSGCLGNLRRIAAATLMYAAEDARDQIVPLHKMDVLSIHAMGFPASGPWPWRTALPHAFGGRTPIMPLPTGAGKVTILQREDRWGAPTRGLNAYVSGEDISFPGPKPAFRCPADTGYPEAAGLWESPDIPLEAADIRCYDFLGNSYRSNNCGLVWPKGSSVYSARFCAAFTSGAKGHGATFIETPSRVVIYSDPLFYSVVRQLTDPSSYFEPIPGWHGKFMADNVAYCDGSARMTQVGEIHDEWSYEELEEMGLSPSFMIDPGYFLRRGPTWQMECYPTPGALTKVYNPNGTPQFDGSEMPYMGWPFDNFTENDCPLKSRDGDTPSGLLEMDEAAATVVADT